MKKQIKLVSFLVIILTVGFSCGKDDNNTTNSGLKLLWTYPLSNQNDIYKYVSIRDNILYDKGVLIGDADNGTQMLKMIDTDTKETKWKWSEVVTPSFSIKRSYQYQNYLVYQVGKHSYGFNLENGKSTFSVNQKFTVEDWVSGIGNTFFISSYEDEAKIYMGDINTGTIQVFLSPNYKRQFPISAYQRSIYPITPTVYNNDTLLVIPFLEPADTGVISQIGTYNLTKKQWLYTNVIMRPNGFYNTTPNGAKVYNGKIYSTCSNHLVCFDLLTGKEIWRNTDILHAFPFAFGGIDIYDDKVIANCEDGSLYAIDINTGYKLWTVKGVGGPKGFVRYYKGFLYLLGSGSGSFYVVDVNNGNVVLKEKAPNDGDGHFQWNIVIVPPKDSSSKGKVMLSTYKNLYMYETWN